MDVRVRDGTIEPLKHRILCDLGKIPGEDIPWPTDAAALLAFSDAERDLITAYLDDLRLPYTVEAVDQPNAADLAACQGHVLTRSDALQAMSALGSGEPADNPNIRLLQLEQKVTALEAKEITPS